MQVDVWRRLFWLAVAGMVLGLTLPATAPKDPLDIDLALRLMAPTPVHWLGTDELGRDVLSRLLIGSGRTVAVAMLALVAATLLGLVLGTLAGYYNRRWPDKLFNAIAAVLTAVPPLLVVAAVLGAVGSSLEAAYAVMAGLMWVAPARMMRSEVIAVTRTDYVAASRVLGAGHVHLLARVIFPNAVQAPLAFSLAMLTEIIALEAGLSFLGFGVQPPEPSLGRMIFDGLAHIGTAWWLTLFPALALAGLIVGFSLIVPRAEVPHG